MVLKSKTLNVATDPVAGEVWIRLEQRTPHQGTWLATIPDPMRGKGVATVLGRSLGRSRNCRSRKGERKCKNTENFHQHFA